MKKNILFVAMVVLSAVACTSNTETAVEDTATVDTTVVVTDSATVDTTVTVETAK